MLNRSILLSIIILLISCNTETPKHNTNGFDSACQIFSDAPTKELNPEEFGIYIAKKLDNMDAQFADKEVREVYHALFNVDPSQRYSLFKESAEITLKRSWDCEAMKQLYEPYN